MLFSVFIIIVNIVLTQLLLFFEQGKRMTETYDIEFDCNVPITIQCLYLLKILIEDVHKNFNSFRSKYEIGRFFNDMVKRNESLNYMFDTQICAKSIKEDHVIIQLSRLMVLQCSNIRFGFLDGQKRHYVMTMCLCNKKPEYFTLAPFDDWFIDDSESKNHLSQLGLMTTERAYRLLSDKFLRSSDVRKLVPSYAPECDFDVLGKKSFPVLKKKSHCVIESHQMHQGLTLQDFLLTWFAKLKGMGSRKPSNTDWSVLDLEATYYSVELHEMPYRKWAAAKDNKNFSFLHMNNLRAIAVKELVEEENLQCIVDLKTTDFKNSGDFKDESEYHKYLMNFCGEKKGACGLLSQNSMSGKHALTSLVLFMTSMYYNPETLKTFENFIRGNGTAKTQDLHDSFNEGLRTGGLSLKYVSF